MGADDDVHGSLTEPRDDRLLLRRRPEPREKLDPGRERREPVGEGGPVLLREHRRRHEHRDLVAVGHRLERRAQRHLGLAVTDVARDEAVHRPARLHVALDVLDRAELVRRLLEPERRLELPLPRRVRGERVALGDGTLRVEPEELLGHLAERGAHRLLHPLPRGTAEPVEPHLAGVRAQVLGDEIEALDGEVELVALGVLEQEEVALPVADRHRPEPEVAPEAVVLVDDDVADRAGRRS